MKLNLAILAAVPFLSYAYSTGADYRSTGAPGDESCARCHDGPFNPPGGAVRIVFPAGQTYTPGVPQQWTVTVNDPSGGVEAYGFQLTARLVSNLVSGQAGNLTPADDSTMVRCDDNQPRGAQGCPAGATVQFIENGRVSRSNTWRVNWTPPAANAGNVRIYIAGGAGNGNSRATGDQIYTASYELVPAAAAQPPQSRTVVNGATLQPGIAAGAWMTIFGANLASATRTWRPDEIIDGRLPLQLDDVSVTVNNKPAAVYFISPGQINALAPSDDALGPVEVRVTNARGTTAATAQLQRFAPGFFKFDGKYVAAVHLDGTPTITRPAAPGDIILLFGTGFGATDPVAIRFGGVPATVSYAGLTGPGLYQFNVVVPDVPDGDVPVVAEIGGIVTAADGFVTIARRGLL